MDAVDVRANGMKIRAEFRQHNEPPPRWRYLVIALICFAIAFLFLAKIVWGAEVGYTNEQIADAIYLAEGGAKTSHPYGILAHYKHTTPRQACINTIIHAKKDWNGKGDFIAFLGSRYAPIGVANDPTGLNKFWIRNVRYFLQRSK